MGYNGEKCQVCKKADWAIRHIKLYVCIDCNQKFLTYKDEEEKKLLEIDAIPEHLRTPDQQKWWFEKMMEQKND